jgi:short-subunit dehydrogenase
LILGIDSIAKRMQQYWAQKVVVVTGASSGLGLAIATAFASAGASLVLAARDASRLESAALELRPLTRHVLDIPTDVTDPEQVERLFHRAIDALGRIDALVNCVGVSNRGRALDTTPEEFARLLEINLLSVVRCTRAAAPHLLQSKGHLVNIGSLSGKTASRYLGAYPVSKFALAAYTQQLRLELEPEGLHVLLVSPGPIARDDAGQRYQHQTAELPAAAGRPGGGAKLKGIDPQKLAQAILRACQRRQPELVMPRRARLLFALQHLWPRFGDWLLRKVT